MQGSTPQHYTIADFLKWSDDDELVLNPKFQRGAVWSAPARSYLIDSILRGYPIPKLLLRTTVDRDNRRTIRDVVDGQQRLRTIIDFAGGRFTLGVKAGEFQGLRYTDLENELKDSFLGYKLTCEQLLNASDEDVLEVFVRINSNAVPVNEAELRNARFENDFSDLVKAIAKAVPGVWALGVLSNRERVRMLDQSLIAEILGFRLFGVTDGGETRLTRLYEDVKGRTKDELPQQDELVEFLYQAAGYLGELAGEPLVARPHFIILVAALMHRAGTLPPGKIIFDDIPRFDGVVESEATVQSLIALNDALASDEPPPQMEAFKEARVTTQRMKSRQVRFEYFCRALAGEYS